MAFIEWSPDLDLPHAGINAQHKSLLAALNALADAVSRENDSDPTETLVFLTHYTEEHFRDEEALMVGSDFAGYDAHREEHNALFRAVEGRVQAFLAGGDAGELLDFLRDWFIGHICGCDRDFAHYLAERG